MLKQRCLESRTMYFELIFKVPTMDSLLMVELVISISLYKDQLSRNATEMSSPVGLSSFMKKLLSPLPDLQVKKNAFVSRDFNLAPFRNTKFTLKRKEKKSICSFCAGKVAENGSFWHPQYYLSPFFLPQAGKRWDNWWGFLVPSSWVFLKQGWNIGDKICFKVQFLKENKAETSRVLFYLLFYSVYI